MRLEYDGKLTTGYYNDMEAGYPVFIDGQSLSDIVKSLLSQNGLSSNFCDDEDERGYGGGTLKDNHLIGKRCRLVLEILD